MIALPLSTRRCTRQSGFTLVELLVVLAVFGIIMAAMAASLTGAARSTRANAVRVESSEASQLVSQILTYHVRLAGYVGADPASRVGTLCGRSVEIPDDSTITVRYFEDRRYGAAEATNGVTCASGDDVTHITFSFDDASGVFSQNGAAVLNGVEAFEVVEYLTDAGVAVATFPIPDSELSSVTGVRFRLAVGGRESFVAVPFVNLQRVFFDD